MRWRYLITRFFIIALILAAIWIGKDSLLRRALIHSGESLVGARVEIGQVRTSVSEGKVYISKLAIADPRDTMRNLFQAESAYLQLDPECFLHRDIVVEHGTTTQIVFGSPRTKSGALDNHSQTADPHSLPVDAVPSSEAAPMGQQWLDQFHPHGNISDNELETIRIAKKIQSLWPEQIKSQQQQVNGIREQLARVNELIKIKDPNPLRDQERIETATRDLLQLHEMAEELRAQLHKLKDDAIKDRDALVSARQRDENRLLQLVRINRFDGGLVSQILLGENQKNYAAEIVRWFGWFRNAIPDPRSDFKPSGKRGIDVCFSGQEKRPSLLIKSLDLDGEGRLAGQHFHFSGVATNISAEPWLHDQPVNFQIRAQGKHHVVVDCSLDRRTKTWNDTLNIQCPDLHMPNQALGDINHLHINVSPCRMQSDIQVAACNDRLSGSLVFRHSDFIMQIDHLQDLAGGQEMAELINLDLATLDQYQIRAELGGTFDDPIIEFNSDLGDQLVQIMNHVAKSRAESQMAQQQKRLNRILDQQFKDIDQQVITSISDLAKILSAESATIAQLKEVLPHGKRSGSRIR